MAEGKIRLHEKSHRHITWQNEATNEEKALLRTAKTGIAPPSSKEIVAQKLLEEKYDTYCRRNKVAPSDDAAWKFVQLEREYTVNKPLFDFWLSKRFAGLGKLNCNTAPIARLNPSFVYQFIMGQHGRRVCTVKPTKAGCTHQVDGLFLSVVSGKLDDLVKIITFDVFDNGAKRNPHSVPYEVIESTPKLDDVVYALVNIVSDGSYIGETIMFWQRTLALFGGQSVEEYSIPDKTLAVKLRSRFAVEYRVLQQEIIPLFIYFLNTHHALAGGLDWKDSISCRVTPADLTRDLKTGDVYIYCDCGQTVPFDEQITSSLIVVPDGRGSNTFTTPHRELKASINKSSVYSFKKTKGDWCDDKNNKPTWSIDDRTSLVRHKLLPAIRSIPLLEDVNPVYVRRFTKLGKPHLEVFLQGIGSDCSDCGSACHILLANDFFWMCRACRTDKPLKSVIEGLENNYKLFNGTLRALGKAEIHPEITLTEKEKKLEEREERKRAEEEEREEQKRKRVERINKKRKRKEMEKMKTTATEEEEEDGEEPPPRIMTDEEYDMLNNTPYADDSHTSSLYC